MKKFFAKAKSLKWIIAIIGVVSLIGMDMAFYNTETIINGTFRSDALFTASPSPATTVSIIASDNAVLASPHPTNYTSLTFTEIKDMVKKSIDLVGGISTYVQNGDSVIIKPNLVGAKIWGNGENTNMNVVKAIIMLIYDQYGTGCTVFVGEGSARSTATMGGTLWNATGYRVLLTDPLITAVEPVQFVDLNDEAANGVNIVTVPAPWNLCEPWVGDACRIHKYLISPNVKYINVPVLKMHEPGITCCLKNQIGIGAGEYYGYNKISGGTGPAMIHHSRFNAANNYKTWQDEELTDLTSCIDHVDLCVVDALMCLETSKTETGSNDVRLNTIIAGPDIVAIDHVCARMIGSNPDDIAHITMGAKIGLGTNDADSITIVGENIATKYTYRFDRSGSMHAKYGQGNRVWLISDPFPYVSMATQYLAGEAALNPSNGNADWSIPYYFFDDRIDLNSFHSDPGTVVTYCFTNVYSPSALSNKELWINSEEDIIVYLNGVNVYNYSGSRPNGNLVTDKPTINLLAGENRLLIKVLNTTGCYDFALNICEPGEDGNRVDGIKFYIKNYNEPAALNPSPTLSTPSNNTQTIQLGNAVANIVYTWGGAATDVTVAGLPAGVTATKNMGAKTVTISGTPSGAGASTYTVTTVGGTGGPIVSGGTITCIACAALAKLSIVGLAPPGTYRLALFNAAGTVEIKTLAAGGFLVGNSDFMFDRTGIATGTYTFKVLNGVTVVNSGTVILP